MLGQSLFILQMKTYLIGSALILSVALTGCAPAVHVEQQANVNYANYHTFDFADTEVRTNGDRNPLLRSSIAQDRIKQAIAAELGKRGLRQSPRRPDFLVTTHTYVEQVEQTVYDTQPAYGYAYPYAVTYRGGLLPVNYNRYYSPAYYSTPRTERYREGTLVIDFIDGRTRSLVWRGSLADPVNDPARLGSDFSEAAKDILAKFPVTKVAKQ